MKAIEKGIAAAKTTVNAAATVISAGQQAATAAKEAQDAGQRALATAKNAAAALTAQAHALLGGRAPVWLHASFREEVLGQSLAHEAKPGAPAELSAVLESLSLVLAQLQALSASPASAVQAAAALVHDSFRQSLAACQHMTPAAATEPQPTQALLTAVVGRARALGAGGCLVVPGGWHGGSATVFVLHCHGRDEYTLCVCTASGDGLSHHPVRLDEGTARRPPLPPRAPPPPPPPRTSVCASGRTLPLLLRRPCRQPHHLY